MLKKGFTLVELIVVITILAILATVAFVSFQGYTVSSRDSVRMTDMKLIQKALDLELTKNNQVPYPSNYITLALNGDDFGYQGDAGINVLSKLGISDEILDPLDNILYTYATDLSRTKFQLLGFLESQLATRLGNNLYADSSNRIPLLKGDEIGIIFDEITGKSIHLNQVNIDITGNENKYGLYIESGTAKVSSGDEVIASLLDFRINPQGSCYNILKNGLSIGDGIYNIINKNGDRVDVYCNMSQQGGGWTLIIKADGNNTTFQYDSNLWVNSNSLNSGDLSLDKNEFKSELFSDTTFHKVLLVLETNDIQKELVIDKYAGSLQEIFTSNYSPTNLGKEKWIDSVGDASMQPNCNQEGFNARKVRIGYSSNNETDCISNDSYIGVGLSQRNGSDIDMNFESSVGNNCGSTLCSNGNKEVNSFGYLYIR